MKIIVNNNNTHLIKDLIFNMNVTHRDTTSVMHCCIVVDGKETKVAPSFLMPHAALISAGPCRKRAHCTSRRRVQNGKLRELKPMMISGLIFDSVTTD